MYGCSTAKSELSCALSHAPYSYMHLMLTPCFVVLTWYVISISMSDVTGRRYFVHIMYSRTLSYEPIYVSIFELGPVFGSCHLFGQDGAAGTTSTLPAASSTRRTASSASLASICRAALRKYFIRSCPCPGRGRASNKSPQPFALCTTPLTRCT